MQSFFPLFAEVANSKSPKFEERAFGEDESEHRSRSKHPPRKLAKARFRRFQRARREGEIWVVPTVQSLQCDIRISFPNEEEVNETLPSRKVPTLW